MAVPCGDERDYAFAKHFHLKNGMPEIKNIFANVDISQEAHASKYNVEIANSDFLDGLNYKQATKKAIEELEKIGQGKGKTNYRLRDAVFSRQRYWGEPFPVYYVNGLPQMIDAEFLPIVLPEVEKYLPTEDGQPPLGNAADWAWDSVQCAVVSVQLIDHKTVFPLELNTMPGWAGSSWYWMRYMDAHNTNEFASKEALDYWQNVDLYIGGSEHATGHLLYSRFWNKFLKDKGFAPTEEPFKKLINQGMILGLSAYFTIQDYKFDFPVLSPENGLIRFEEKTYSFPISEKPDIEKLNVIYKDIHFHLIKNDYQYEDSYELLVDILTKPTIVKNKYCILKVTFEVEDPKPFRTLYFIVEKERFKVNSNTELHISEITENIRAEFISFLNTKSIFNLGIGPIRDNSIIIKITDFSLNISSNIHSRPFPVLVDYVDHVTNELNINLFKNWMQEFQGHYFLTSKDNKFYCYREVEKMSKSKYNVVTPDDICEEYGADTLRLYEMFLGPLEQAKPWNTAGITGVFGFLKKLWKLYYDEKGWVVTANPASKEALKTLHKTIKKVQEDIEGFSFNTSVSQFMICVNELTAMNCHERSILEPLAVLISPYAPHIAEELWERLGHEGSISTVPFPKFNPEYLVESSKEYPVSFNGKMRFTLELPLDLSAAQIEEIVMKDERTIKQLEGRTPNKVIIVPGKIINLVG